MRILLTGASSFTGFWFARELRRAGHDVTCLFQAPDVKSYDGLRVWRVANLCAEGPSIFAVSFGKESFLQAVQSGSWDVYSHHAADVMNYRSMDFDAVRAVANNTHNLRQVLSTLASAGCRRVVLTGSVFEGGEGAGSEGLPDILPYGLSKALTAQVFRYECLLAGFRLGKFVIPNPFGAYQEPRFLEYLMATWKKGETARVATPAYIRDNIPVDLLALDYREFLETLPEGPGYSQRNPSGIVGDQGSFALMVAREIRARRDLACDIELAEQTHFVEPLIRINTDGAIRRHPTWSRSSFWDHLCTTVMDA